MQEIQIERMVFSPSRLEPPLTEGEIRSIMARVCIDPFDMRTTTEIATQMVLADNVRLDTTITTLGENHESR